MFKFFNISDSYGFEAAVITKELFSGSVVVKLCIGKKIHRYEKPLNERKWKEKATKGHVTGTESIKNKKA
ncbi:Hypothetical protein CINCED_3A014472 [Cinara cedri]|uniref:Uncharacterized protein n=1 Tax=Cinara cedri TaxID=506608 RepID=A0A5E4MWQ8_9HEMI|nr:Hypothetical protein CINCED_3A014472 [Cinara cedri]